MTITNLKPCPVCGREIHLNSLTCLDCWALVPEAHRKALAVIALPRPRPNSGSQRAAVRQQHQRVIDAAIREASMARTAMEDRR